MINASFTLGDKIITLNDLSDINKTSDKIIFDYRNGDKIELLYHNKEQQQSDFEEIWLHLDSLCCVKSQGAKEYFETVTGWQKENDGIRLEIMRHDRLPRTFVEYYSLDGQLIESFRAEQ